MGPVGEVRSALLVSCAGRGADPAHDGVMELYRLLGDPELAGFQLSLLVEPSLSALRQELTRFLADRAPHDLVLVHISGRLVADGDGALHLCIGEAASDGLSAGAAAVGLAVAELQDALARCRSERVVLLLDCENVEAPAPAGQVACTATLLGDRFRAPGRAVFTLSTAGVVDALRRGRQRSGWEPRTSAAERVAERVLLPARAPAARRHDQAQAAVVWTLVGVALLLSALPAVALVPPVGVALAATGAVIAVMSVLRLAAAQRQDPAWHAPPSGEGVPFYQLYMLRRSQKSKDYFRHH